jgi:multicomponent Na+:H+ antiporter subunit B
MEDIVVRSISRLIVPFIQLYGLYVIFHGHLSPGGGFAGGAIVASSMILYGISFNLEAGSRKLSHDVSSLLESGGALWYLLVGLIGILLGSNFLANKIAGVNLGTPGQLLSSGIIFLLALGIGAKVASTMITLFYSLSGGESSDGNRT